MKILLRHITSGPYVQSPDKWTDDAEWALDFRFLDRAVNYIRTWHLKEVEVAFVFESDEAEVSCISVEKAELRCAA